MSRADSCLALNAVALEKALAGNLIGHRVFVLNRATSSNDIIFQMASDGAGEGLVVFAEEQTAGRGQRGNRWESPPRQGLWFSILLYPDFAPAESPALTTWVAQSIAETIKRELALTARVKSPNDIYIRDRKVAGVLVEMRARPRAPHLAIVGIGINVSQNAADFPPALRSIAISLASAAHRPIDRQKLAAAVLHDLNRSYRASFAP
jgi:BirA family biotin operon repressor/biotin-[acetyl-CoA-carboxylase] ligase